MTKEQVVARIGEGAVALIRELVKESVLRPPHSRLAVEILRAYDQAKGLDRSQRVKVYDGDSIERVKEVLEYETVGAP